MKVPAIVTAGDRGAAKPIYGSSKVYLEVEGRPMVSRVVEALQQVPEVSEVWVVGDPDKLGPIFAADRECGRLHKPLHFIAQFENLYANCWEAFRRVLPDAGPEGRDPVGDDLDQEVLYLSADLPFATPQEISAFVREGRSLECDYVIGLVPEEALDDFHSDSPTARGIRVAFFNLREGRLRQNNLHLTKPARMKNLLYVQEMYEHRHQQEFGKILGLAWELLRSDNGGLAVLYYYALMHLGGVADRHGWRWLADLLRRHVPLPRVEIGVGKLLGTRFRFAITQAGGCAIDVDTEAEYDSVTARFAEWDAAQRARAAALYGPPPLPDVAGSREDSNGGSR